MEKQRIVYVAKNRMSAKGWIMESMAKQEPYYGTYVLDLKTCDWTLSYIRQELCRMNFRSSYSAKNSRWLFIYPKKEAK